MEMEKIELDQLAVMLELTKQPAVTIQRQPEKMVLNQRQLFFFLDLTDTALGGGVTG